MYKEKIEEAKSKMEKTLVALKKDFSTLRAGRANPQILTRSPLIITERPPR